MLCKAKPLADDVADDVVCSLTRPTTVCRQLHVQELSIVACVVFVFASARYDRKWSMIQEVVSASTTSLGYILMLQRTPAQPIRAASSPIPESPDVSFCDAFGVEAIHLQALLLKSLWVRVRR